MSVLQIETAEVFEPLLQPARYKGAWGGRGSGKSHFFAGLLLEDSLAAPGASGGEGLRSICIREVQKDLAQSSKALLEAKLSHYKLGQAQGFKIYRDLIQTPGDGLIIFKGMNDYTADSVKSLEGYKRAWWEEAQTATARSLSLLRPTLRATGSELWFSWNPRRKTDPLDVLLRGKEVPTGSSVVRANWQDNPWFTAELEQERLDTLRIEPDQYGHIWNGDYVTTLSGAYYAEALAKAKDENRIGFLAADPLMTTRAYWDIGGTGAKADACAIWIVQFIGREIRVLRYYEAVGQPYYDAGTNALGQLDAVNSGDYSGFNSSPDYLFAQQQGLQGLDRSAAARGGLYSGGADADRMTFASGLASQNLGNYRNNLMSLANMGQNQSQYMGQLGQNFGNQFGQAMGIKGQADAQRASATAGAQAGYGNALASAASTYMGAGGGGGGGFNLGSMFGGSTGNTAGSSGSLANFGNNTNWLAGNGRQSAWGG